MRLLYAEQLSVLTFQKSLPRAWYSAMVLAVHPITSSIARTSRKRGLPMSLSLNAGNHLQEQCK